MTCNMLQEEKISSLSRKVNLIFRNFRMRFTKNSGMKIVCVQYLESENVFERCNNENQ